MSLRGKLAALNTYANVVSCNFVLHMIPLRVIV